MKDDVTTIEIYSVASNYQGVQPGWFAKILKDKFNVELNIVAPNVSGDADSLYQTRAAAGNLGDIVVLDNADFKDCVDSGLVADITEDIQGCENLMKYEEQIKEYNKNLGEDADIQYGIPAQMNSNGPTGYAEDTVYSMPRIPWDYYSALGSPDMANTDDLLNVLETMLEKYPTNEKGDKAYALSLWSDWDNPGTNAGIEVINQMAKWYGQEAKGSVLIGNDGSIKSLTDKDGTYYKLLQFLYQANQKGLLDPDSGTQDWNATSAKMKNKQVYLFWYNWQRAFWNNPERGAAGDAYVAAPLADLNVYQEANYYFGNGRVWGVGSNVDEAKKAKIMEVLNWLASPEALEYTHCGLKDIIYTVVEDGKYELTKDGYNRDSADIQIPEELGGGLYFDGKCQINEWIVGSVETNPNTAECYDVNYWNATFEANRNKASEEWSQKFNAENEVEYLEKNGQLEITPTVNLLLESDTTDTALIRSQCGQLVCDTSWQMIYAGNESEFEASWANLEKQLEGQGWEKLVNFDTEKYQEVVDARKKLK